jgi:hypothetical protein
MDSMVEIANNYLVLQLIGWSVYNSPFEYYGKTYTIKIAIAPSYICN